MQQVPLLHRLLAALMHFLSLLLTFFLPLIVYFAVRKKSDYFSFHAKEGLNLHFTFFPVFLLLSGLSRLWSPASTISLALILLETVLIGIAAISTLRGKTFSYPVIHYFKTSERGGRQWNKRAFQSESSHRGLG